MNNIVIAKRYVVYEPKRRSYLSGMYKLLLLSLGEYQVTTELGNAFYFDTMAEATIVCADISRAYGNSFGFVPVEVCVCQK